MNTEKLIFNLFKVCDKYIDVDDFVDFESEFAEIVLEFTGMDLYEIYYGENFDKLKEKYKRYREKQDTLVQHKIN